MQTPFESDPILVEVIRGGYVESIHHGRVAVTGPDGRLAGSLGAVRTPIYPRIYPRSSSKPLQTIGMVRAGLELPDELLALVAASHSGEPFHLAGARAILAQHGLDESALQTPLDWPLDDVAKEQVIRDGGSRSRLAMTAPASTPACGARP